ncbi:MULTISPECIES: hypothetical protein [Haloarcula]|nr:hypothetical protein [Halomicroarcula sp. XH51]
MDESRGDDVTALPWYLKAVILLLLLVVLFIIAVDILHFANAF